MTIKKKVVFLTTLWLIGILVAFNITVFYAFLKITTQNEKDLLMERVEGIFEKAGPEDILGGRRAELLTSFLPDDGMIRVLDNQEKEIQMLQNDDDIVPMEREAVKKPESELYYQRKGTVLVVRVPILLNGSVAGTIEMGESLKSIKNNISILISILVLASLGAIGLSLIGGIYLSKWISRPISGMVTTMEEIEQSLEFRKIPLRPGATDELSMMGSTFNRMIDRLEENFARQQQFVSDASHELKTPLTSIEGYANMLRRWGLRDEERGREAVEHIYSEAVRMKEMTQQLLDLASTEDRARYRPETVELVELSRKTAQLLDKVYSRQIEVRTSAEELYLNADPSRISQLLLILLDNALKYSKDPVELSVSVQDDPGVDQQGIEIRVKDSGIGIPQQELNRVFERFYRVDSSRHRKTGGTGLGLAIAKNLVELHRGSIRIESEENVGTEMIVFIPIH
ncbi:HAMP domain-containing histidine kinase [Paenibacillus zeisoli]|uniref:Signal transduction histidine-protein kinase ArlS n=1 Tax=Paenibacillus zeisoli TaxID=2496267 RepID=A0A433XC05_9BACL|nr:HAMP domain-containing histidine kinase [Paenibacillus zeisoli]RUT31592.1 HAMP domain-containing histidine kinase [Paenibacillus zeisoli]